MADQQDFLDELDAERTAANPEFPAILAAVRERRAFIRALAAKREELGISQAEVARRMSSTQPYTPRSRVSVTRGCYRERRPPVIPKTRSAALVRGISS